jgi:hypothetical protein
MNKLFQIAITVITSLLLVSCGGGGGGDSASTPIPTPVPPAPTPAPVPPAPTPSPALYIFLFSDGYTKSVNTAQTRGFTISGVSNSSPIVGGGVATNSNLSQSTFNGFFAYVGTQSFAGSFQLDGLNYNFSASVRNYYSGFFANPVGVSDDENLIVEGSSNIPISVKIGDSGLIYNAKIYSSSSFETQVGTRAQTYSVAVDPSSSTTALITITSVDKDMLGSITSTSYEINRIGIDRSYKTLSTRIVDSTSNITYTYQ